MQVLLCSAEQGGDKAPSLRLLCAVTYLAPDGLKAPERHRVTQGEENMDLQSVAERRQRLLKPPWANAGLGPAEGLSDHFTTYLSGRIILR